MKSIFSFIHFLISFAAIGSMLAACGCSNETPDTETDVTSGEPAFYPIDFCIVTGNDFDEEGTNMVPFTYEHDGITIKFCCKPCLPKFKKNPSKYLVILEEELEALSNESSNEG
ncbi:MAG: hypothetical protein CMI27_00270 [Opitutae bacterium]|nr:hypothetical protein [Opitutae bacterium]